MLSQLQPVPPAAACNSDARPTLHISSDELRKQCRNYGASSDLLHEA
jgi:hypothetical protein